MLVETKEPIQNSSVKKTEDANLSTSSTHQPETCGENKQKKKIVFLLPSLCPGGAERVLVTLMNNLDPEKFSPTLISLQDGEIRSWVKPEIPVHIEKNASVSRNFIPLYKRLKDIQPDLVFSTIVHMNALVLLLKPFFPKTKFIVRESSLPRVLIKEYGWKGRLCKYVYKYLYPTADQVISPSRQIISEFRHALKLTMKNHLRLLNPVDQDKIHGHIAAVDSVDLESLNFVCVGRLAAEKGYRRTLEAMQNFEMNRKWHLHFVGDGPEKETLETMAKDFGLEGNITFHGYQDNPWSIVAACDVFLLPSRWEGMPNASLEALVCGTPVLAMKEAGGIVEIEKLTKPGSVILTNTIEEFVEEMKNAQKKETLKEQSLLPEEFLLPTISQHFEEMLLGL